LRVDPQQSFRVTESKRPQENGIDHRKSGDGRANAEGEGENSDNKKARRLAQGSKTEARVLDQTIDEIAAERFAAFFFEAFLAAEFQPRLAFRFDPTQSGAFQVVGSTLNVRANFFLDLASGLRTPKESRT
jgi:hypothetical protein